ncbi:MAG TPA: hypothetical protein VMS96_09685 [Terriglobales bacterium]|nr:hypothetical protein [Terriglobales bacterium]
MHIAALVALMCIVVPRSFAEKKFKRLEDFPKVCGVDVDRDADGVFAKLPGRPWQQFPGVKTVPKQSRDQMAQYWHGEHGSLVQMAARDKSFTRYHEYCFAEDGRLTRLTYETRAAEGWGYATTGAVNEAGRLVPASSRFFGVRTNRTIPRPPEAEEAPWVLHPKIYKRLEKLPFAKLIAEQKKEDAQAH